MFIRYEHNQASHHIIQNEEARDAIKSLAAKSLEFLKILGFRGLFPSGCLPATNGR